MVVNREAINDHDAARGGAKQGIEQCLGPAESQWEGAVHLFHQGREPRALTAGLHIPRQRGAGSGGVAGTDEPGLLLLVHQKRDRWNRNQRKPQRHWSVSRQAGAAAQAGIRVMFMHLVNTVNGQ